MASDVMTACSSTSSSVNHKRVLMHVPSGMRAGVIQCACRCVLVLACTYTLTHARARTLGCLEHLQ